MKRRLLLLLLVMLFIVGLALLFWPAPVGDGAQHGTPLASERAGEAGADGINASAPRAAPATAPQPAVPPASSSLTQQARDAWYGGDIAAAMELYQQAIDANPDDPEPHAGYGRLLTLAHGYDRALPLLERARDLQPGEAQPWLDLATLYERAQRFDQSFAARAEAARIVGAEAITRDEQGRFVVVGETLW